MNANRLRLALEGSHEQALAWGGSLTPSLELGLRHDGGDGITGGGVEIGGGLRYRDPATGLTIEGSGRVLTGQDEYREWGLGGSVRFDPGAGGRGLSFSLFPTWGQTSSGVERLWDQDVAELAREMGLARFGKLSVDGTKVRANASKRKAMSYERMGQEAVRLQAEIEALLRKAGAVDAEEAKHWGEAFRGDELPEELQRREKRLAAIQAAKARLEAAQRARDDERGREPGQDRNPRGGRPYKRAYGEPEPKAQSNFTDPESQIMKTSSEGFQQCYNAQMAVDGEHQIIVATQVGPQASDQGQLVGMLDEINETFGVEPAVVLADAGYCNEPDLLELEDRGIDAHVALGREGKSQVAVDPARLPATHRMGEKLASPAGKARYAQRKWLSEAPNGWIKEVLGFRRFSLRGLAKVRGEWDLVCLALNIKRMGTLATC